MAAKKMQKPSLRARTYVFRDKHPLIGPVFWMLSIQYYLTQYFVAQAWRTPFSLRFNTISDLGNTVCGQYGSRYVCSPQHSWMNASFITLGLTMMLGSLFIPSEFRTSRASRIGFWCMAVAGFGTLMVGVFPENAVIRLHATGAALPFLLGNIALILFSFALGFSLWLRSYTLLSGLVALVALPFFLTDHYGRLGTGGVERIVAYPQSIWLIVFGVYMSMSHLRRIASKSKT